MASKAHNCPGSTHDSSPGPSRGYRYSETEATRRRLHQIAGHVPLNFPLAAGDQDIRPFQINSDLQDI